MKLRAVVVIALLASLALTAPAPGAEDPSPDKVTLRDGTVVSGRIVAETKDGVRIRTPKGEFLLERKRIEKVERTSVPVAKSMPGKDRVTLRDGEIVMGRILEADEERIRIRVGETVRDIPRTKIVELRRADAPEPDAPPGKPAPERTSAFSLLRNPGEALKTLTAALQLSKAQHPKTEAALKGGSKLVEEVMTKFSGGSRAEAMTALRKVAAAFRERMKGILTDVQFSMFKKIAPPPAGNR